MAFPATFPCLCLALLYSASQLQTTSGAAFPGESDLVASLPGLTYKPTYKHYSGYLEAENGVFLHYWFFESQSSNPSKDPVALWLDGGPGCSSMLGALTGLGPIRLSKNGSLSENPYAWNQKANLLFLESPVGTGFSYKADGIYNQTDDSTALLNYNALKSFFSKFPHLSDNDFYVTGESYAGILIPTLSVELLKHKFPKNFKGSAIGNGYMDGRLNSNSAAHFAYYHGLSDTLEWETQLKACCPTSSPWTLRSCDFTDASNKPCLAYSADMLTRASKLSVCEAINPYNIYADCEPPSNLTGPSGGPSRLEVQQSLLFGAFPQVTAKPSSVTGFSPPCYNEDHVTVYLNQPQVRKALWVSEQAWQWSPCRNTSDIGYTKTVPSVKGHLKTMVDAGLKVLIYNGDVDLICNYLGAQWLVESLGYPTSKPYHPWVVAGQVAGFAKFFLANHQMALVTIRGAGHVAPADRPAETLEMFNSFVKGF